MRWPRGDGGGDSTVGCGGGGERSSATRRCQAVEQARVDVGVALALVGWWLALTV